MTVSSGAINAVDMRGISKSFGGIRALEGVDLVVKEGSIHALLGGNGAGKSTILKILCGVEGPTQGVVEIFGERLNEFTPEAARRAGVVMIFQEMSLVPSLTVAQNIFLTREPRAGGFFLDDRAAIDRSRELFGTLSVSIDPRARTDTLSAGQQQLTEIAKALSQNAKVLILDEPTSALSSSEIRYLFELLHRLRDRGVAIIYVSHKMDEILGLADTVTVLRNGRHVTTQPIAGLTLESMIEYIVGRRVNAFAWKPRKARRSGEKLIELRGICGPRWPIDVSFAVYPGEVVGIAGLLGSGRSELARVIAGVDPVRSGELRVHGERLATTSVRRMIDAGIVMIPEDRRVEGLILEHSIAANMTLPIIDKLSAWGFVRERDARGIVARLVQRLGIKVGSVRDAARSLSGGNQQKVVIAKWLASEPDVLILDEPTAGIDIGSKAEIVELIRELAANGSGVIMISSELPELLAVSDRILVMQSGRLAREIEQAELESWAAAGAVGEERISEMEQQLELAIQQRGTDG